MRRLGFDKLIDGKASRERDLVAAMVAGRIIAPEASKLAMTHAFSDTTLAEEFSVADAHEDELYAAMDWLIERQDKMPVPMLRAGFPPSLARTLRAFAKPALARPSIQPRWGGC